MGGGTEIYGVSYAVPETQWNYMFNTDQLGDGEELTEQVHITKSN